jgi:RNA polymerase sigma factor (sigma-70 family)
MGQDAAGRFPTTRWSIIAKANKKIGESIYQQALAELCQTYWQPLYAFARRSGNNHHDAMDLTQGFFAHLLDHHALSFADPDKGRFRTFLLVSFKNYVSNQRRYAGTARRGGGHSLLSLTAADFDAIRDFEPTETETPETIFQKEWAQSLLKQVRSRLEEECIKADKAELFQLLEPHLVNSPEALPREEISNKLGLSSAALAMTLYRLRRRYREILREEVAATVTNPADVDDELSELITLFGTPPKR